MKWLSCGDQAGEVMTVGTKPVSRLDVPTAASPRRPVRLQLMIFTGVNAVLLLLWLCLSLAGVSVHGALWIWPIVMLVWLARILFVDRRVPRERVFTNEQIEREVRKIR